LVSPVYTWVAMKNTAELRLYYQDKCYSWDDLVQRSSCFSTDKIPQIISVPAQKRFFTALALLYGLTEYKTILTLGTDYSDTQRQDLLRQLNCECPDELIHGENSLPLLAVATSGSQAAPKIALISRDNILSHCYNFNKIIPMQETSLWLNCLPMNHIAGIMILYRCWFNKAIMLLHDAYEVKQIWHDLHAYPVTHISLVPIMLLQLLEHSRDALPPKNLRYVIVGGDKLSDSLYQRALSAGWPIYISYGMTEATSTVAIGQTPESLELLPGFEAQISEKGLLKLKGSMIISAYADFEPAIDADHWYESTDKAAMNASYLTILGRNDHMIISGGENIAPEYIEDKLSDSPYVNDVAVGTALHPDWGNSIVAVVCGNIKDLQQWVKDNIKTSSRPHYYLEATRIPRNQLGKINRIKLLQMICDAKLIKHD